MYYCTHKVFISQVTSSQADFLYPSLLLLLAVLHQLTAIFRPLTARLESEFYVTTDGQPASLYWNKAPFWAYDQIFVIA
jgi:hypothetical protein